MRFSILIAAAIVGVLSTSAPASAHTDMTDSTPAASAKVRIPVADVSITFTEPIGTGPATVNVRGPEGTNLAEGKPRTSGNQVVQPIAELTAKGKYQVDYRVVGLDGHPVTGSYTFTFVPRATPSPSPAAVASPAVETTAPAIAPAPSDVAAPAAATGDSQRDSSGLLVPGIGAGVVALLIGGGALVARRRRHEEAPKSS